MLICIMTKNVITSCSVTMMLFLHLEVKPLMTLTTVLYLSCALISGHLATGGEETPPGDDAGRHGQVRHGAELDPGGDQDPDAQRQRHQHVHMLEPPERRNKRKRPPRSRTRDAKEPLQHRFAAQPVSCIQTSARHLLGRARGLR